MVLTTGFNPRPPLLAGESNSIHLRMLKQRCFNPRPPLLAGESVGHRPDARTKTGFNPRPPLLAGESSSLRKFGVGWHVSIHARHCWRANPRRARHRILLVSVSIHARHCWRANPKLWSGALAEVVFQSTPAIAGGRIVSPGAVPAPATCFNPRPPLLAGESIARKCMCTGFWFQSTPAIAGGRIQGSCQWCRPASGFNPRPPLLAGESPARPS